MLPEIAEAAEVLAKGGVVAFPTDTVWGLLADPWNPEAVGRLRSLKGREAQKPLQLLMAEPEQAQSLLPAGYHDPRFDALAETFWPGPLTVVVPGRRVPPWISPAGTWGLRVPDQPVLRALLRQAGGVLAASSLNRAGAPPVRSFGEAQAFGADYVFPGKEPPGVASTVVDLTTASVLREGAIPAIRLWPYLKGRTE